MLGTDFNKIFDEKVDKTYSSFLNFPKKNRLFKEALISSIENIYRNLDEQREYDELASLIKTQAVFTPNPTNNSLGISAIDPTGITDYMHLLTVKSKYRQDTFLDITNVKQDITAPNNTKLTINTTRNNLRTYELVEIYGVTGISGINGEKWLKKINNSQFYIFNDKDLTSPPAYLPTEFYVNGGDIYRIWYEYCKPYFSDRKIAIYGKPTMDRPKYEISENNLKFYPLDEECQEVTIDYITNNLVLIDPEDDTIDLELTYPSNFLYTVAKEASKLFAESIKDMELLQTSSMELAEEK